MRTVHVVGRKNHGKTTLIVELLAEFNRRGLRVGSIKHSGHIHDLDTPGTDSCRHRLAGADPAAIATRDTIGVFFARRPGADLYQTLAPVYVDCDLVLVEGDLERPAPKIEVWRAAVGTSCLAASRSDILAVVTDDPLDVPVPIWRRSDPAALVDPILALLSQE